MTRPKNKYRKGYTIFGLDDLMYRLEKGEWVYLRGKVIHPGFIKNMTLQVVNGFLKTHSIHEAIDQQKEYYAKLTEKWLAEKH